MTICWPRQYVTEIYNDASVISEGTDITVSEGISVPNINIQLEVMGKITGTVTDLLASPLANIRVSLHSDMDNIQSQYQVVALSTDESGNYEFLGLSPGSYLLRFYDSLRHGNMPQSYLTKPYW